MTCRRRRHEGGDVKAVGRGATTRIARIIAAAPEAIYAAFMDPGALAAWLPPGEMTGLDIGDSQIAVYNVGGTFYATYNICTHGFASLTDGYLEDDEVECPLHGGRFNVTDGSPALEPAECPLKTFRVRVSGDDVEVLLPE